MNETFLSIASLHNQCRALVLFMFDDEVALGTAFMAERRSQALEVKNSAPSAGAALPAAARPPCRHSSRTISGLPVTT